jgi:hypothetical protein
MVGKLVLLCYDSIMSNKLKSWNEGFTKTTHPSVFKISETFKRKKLDNFKQWRDRMKKIGKIRSIYPPFRKNGDLAELIGAVLGDGHIGFFPRSESLTISCNTKNKGFIKRYKNLIRIFFEKEPHEGRVGPNKGCTRIRVYQKNISKRLGLPVGNRKNINFQTPNWILKNKECLERYLRGLYEAEGSFCVHKPTYTYKFLFSNRNISLLNNVYNGLKILGFHPHRSNYQIQISKKDEVYKIKNLLKFRQY